MPMPLPHEFAQPGKTRRALRAKGPTFRPPRGSHYSQPEQHSQAGKGSRALRWGARPAEPHQKRSLWALRSITVANARPAFSVVEYQNESQILKCPYKLRHGFRVQHMPGALIIANGPERDS